MDADVASAFGGASPSVPSPAGISDADVAAAFSSDSQPAAMAASPPGFWTRLIQGYAMQHPLSAAVGETAAHGVSSVAGPLAASVAATAEWPFVGAQKANQDYRALSNELTYDPRTPLGQQLSGAASTVQNSPYNPGQWPGMAGNWGARQAAQAGAGPGLQSVISGVPQVATALVGGALGAPGENPTISEIQGQLDRAAAESPQSMGAAVAAPRITAATPELQQAIVDAARRNGGAVNTAALSRQLQADSLPVPVRLTEGQATQDPQLLSLEQNGRGANPVLANHFDQQNKALVQNLQTVRDNVGPEVFSANPIEHGDSLIAAYKAKDAAAQADISAKYKALTDANGGSLPFDGVSFADAANAALKQQMKAPFLPSGVRSIIDQYSDGEPMTLENFENLRTTLAAAGRTADRSGDGNANAAISLVRNQLENMPVSAAAAPVKALADEARQAAAARFQALRADPAYNAAVNDTVPPDRFVSRFITGPGATRDGVTTMRQNLAGNDTAQQTISVAAVDHLRNQAGVDQPGSVNFSQSGFNKALQTLQARGVFEPQTSETLGNLGETARATQFQPRGSWVNNSNTLVGALGQTGATLAEHGANMTAHGVPVGTITRQVLSGRSAARAAQRATSPGAGIDRIDLPAR